MFSIIKESDTSFTKVQVIQHLWTPWEQQHACLHFDAKGVQIARLLASAEAFWHVIFSGWKCIQKFLSYKCHKRYKNQWHALAIWSLWAVQTCMEASKMCMIFIFFSRSCGTTTGEWLEFMLWENRSAPQATVGNRVWWRLGHEWCCSRVQAAGLWGGSLSPWQSLVWARAYCHLDGWRELHRGGRQPLGVPGQTMGGTQLWPRGRCWCGVLR